MEGINFRPVGKKKLRKNSFGRLTGTSLKTAPTSDCWNLAVAGGLQTCSPDRGAKRKNPGVRGTISAECFLSAVGWSTCVRTSLRGGLVKNDLIKQWVRRISGVSRGQPIGPDDKEPPFLIDGKPGSLIDVFKYFQELITKRVFLPHMSPHGPMKIPRHLVAGRHQIRGRCKTAFGNMVPGDQVRWMRYGSSWYVEPPSISLKSPDCEASALFTNLGGNSFALTDFNHGTFVFPKVDDAASAKRQKRRMRQFKHRHNSEIYITSA